MIYIRICKQHIETSMNRLQTIRILFTVIGVGMGVMALVLLLFAFLATGATRKNIYSGAKCMMGGRVSAAFVSEEGNTIYCPADTIYCLLFPVNRIMAINI